MTAQAPQLNLPTITETLGVPAVWGNRGTCSDRSMETTFGSLLAHVALARFTGLMELEAGGIRTLLYYYEGQVCSCELGPETLTLSRLLLRKGRLSVEDLARVVHHMTRALPSQEQEEMRFGECLVELGLMVPGEVNTFLREHMLEKVFYCFRWETVHYHLHQGATQLEGKYRFQPPPLDRLILSGISRYMLATRREALLQPVMKHYIRATCEDETINFRSMRRFLRAAKTARTVRGLLDSDGLRRTAWMSLILAARAMGLIDFRALPGRKSAQSVEYIHIKPRKGPALRTTSGGPLCVKDRQHAEQSADYNVAEPQPANAAEQDNRKLCIPRLVPTEADASQSLGQPQGESQGLAPQGQAPQGQAPQGLSAVDTPCDNPGTWVASSSPDTARANQPASTHRPAAAEQDESTDDAVLMPDSSSTKPAAAGAGSLRAQSSLPSLPKIQVPGAESGTGGRQPIGGWIRALLSATPSPGDMDARRSARQAFEAGKEYVRRGDLTKAKEKFYEATRLDPQPEHQLYAAWAASRESSDPQGQAVHAVEAFVLARKMLKEDANHAKAHSIVGAQLAQIGDHRSAWVHLRRAITQDPFDLEARRWLKRLSRLSRLSSF